MANITIYSIIHKRSLSELGKRIFNPHAAMSNSLRTEDAPRTVGGRFRYRISLPYRRSLFFTPNASENAPRTVGSLF